MKHPVALFSTRLIVSLLGLLGAHLTILYFKAYPLFDNKIILSYAVNALLAIGILWALHSFKEKYSSQIGFLFLGSSFLKFLVFFIIFYGGYKADGEINSFEFFAFFAPYGLSLVLETFCLSQWLNKM